MPLRAHRRGIICLALGGIAFAPLLVVWVARDSPPTLPVQRDQGAGGVQAFAAPAPAVTQFAPSASPVDSDDALAALVVALGDADANVRADAVADLGLSSDTQAESLLAITAMQDPASAVRVEALYALGSLGAESQLEAFRYALGDPDRDVRKAAISALEELGAAASTELLRVALDDRDAAIRATAAEALADLRTAR